MVKAAQVAVGATATLVFNTSVDHPRPTVMVRNTSSTSSVFFGGPDVTTANGYELVAGASMIFQNSGAKLKLYAVAAISGVVHYLAY
jgi:hypothetical protein